VTDFLSVVVRVGERSAGDMDSVGGHALRPVPRLGRVDVVALLLLFFVAYFVRLQPSAWSPLPYNIDGFPQARLAEDLLSNGWHFGNYSSPVFQNLDYNSKMPVLPFFIAIVSRITGLDVFSVIRLVLPLVGATTVLSGFFVAREVFRDRYLSFLTAVYLSFAGLFVYVTSAAMKENFALAVFLFSLFLFVRKDRTGPGRCRGSGVGDLSPWLLRVLWSLSLVFLFLTHHLTFLVAVSVFGMALFFRLWNILLFSRPRKEVVLLLVDLALLFFAGLLGFLYYRSVSLSYMRFFRGSGVYLFVSSFAFWFFVGLASFFFSSAGDGKKDFSWHLFLLPFIALVMGVGLVFFNTRFSVFGTMKTPDYYLFSLIPYCAVAFFSMIGVSVIRKADFFWRELVVGGLMAPLSVITFAVAGGVDVASFNLAYRTYNYLDLFFGFIFGVGVLFFLKKSLDMGPVFSGRFIPGTGILGRMTGGLDAVAVGKRVVVGKQVAAVFAVLLVFSTSSLGFLTPRAHGVEDVTSRWEFEGLSALADVVGEDGVVYTDQRYSDILRQYFMVNASSDLPYILLKNRSLPEGFFVVSEEWTTRGAQEYPYGTVKLSREQTDRLFADADFMFSTGPEGSRLLFFSCDGCSGSCDIMDSVGHRGGV